MGWPLRDATDALALVGVVYVVGAALILWRSHRRR